MQNYAKESTLQHFNENIALVARRLTYFQK